MFYYSFSNIEIAGSKNNTFTAIQKEQIDAIQNIDSVKQVSKNHLDTIRRIHLKYSDKALINSGLLFLALVIQIILFRRSQFNKS